MNQFKKISSWQQFHNDDEIMQHKMDAKVHQDDTHKKEATNTQEMHGSRWIDYFFPSILRSLIRSFAITYRELRTKDIIIIVMEHGTATKLRLLYQLE